MHQRVRGVVRDPEVGSVVGHRQRRVGTRWQLTVDDRAEVEFPRSCRGDLGARRRCRRTIGALGTAVPPGGTRLATRAGGSGRPGCAGRAAGPGIPGGATRAVRPHRPGRTCGACRAAFPLPVRRGRRDPVRPAGPAAPSAPSAPGRRAAPSRRTSGASRSTPHAPRSSSRSAYVIVLVRHRCRPRPTEPQTSEDRDGRLVGRAHFTCLGVDHAEPTTFRPCCRVARPDRLGIVRDRAPGDRPAREQAENGTESDESSATGHSGAPRAPRPSSLSSCPAAAFLRDSLHRHHPAPGHHAVSGGRHPIESGHWVRGVRQCRPRTSGGTWGADHEA